MEKFSYNSYPDSTDSSPRSREIDFDNPPPWDDQNHHQQTQSCYKVKFMCSYNGKIQPRPHDNQLTYVNGETKILSVDRGIRFPVLASKLSAVCGGGGGGDVLFKYQLPGEDLDALISVTNDDDLEHMMHEYDRLLRTSSSKPARMRLFLFPSASSPSGGFGSEGSTQSDRDRFVEALNTTVVRSRPESEKSVTAPTSDADFLFGSEKAVSSPPPPPLPTVPVAVEAPLFNDPQQQEAVYRRKSEDAGGYFSPTYAAQNPAPAAPRQQPAIPLTNQQAPPMTTFWQGNSNNNPGGVFPTTAAPGLGLPEQPVYMIPPPTPTPHPGSVYHAPAQPQPQLQGGVMRPVVTGQVNQGGYYPYREQHQPTYSMTQPPVGVVAKAHQQQQQQQPPLPFTSSPPPPPPPQPQYSAVPPPQQVVGLADTRGYYTQATCAGGMGKQVYYTEAPPPPQPLYHGIGLPVTGGMGELMRTGPDGKLVAMNMVPKVSSQNSDSAV